MWKIQILAFLLAALTIPTLAAEEKAEHGEAKKDGGEPKKGKPGTNVDMPFLMAPLTNADGKLTGYAYISTRLTETSESFALAVRDKLPFIQDVMVCDVNGTAVTTAEDPASVGVPRLESRMLADARKVIGTGKVKLITVCTVQIAELHTVQSQARTAPVDQPALDEHKNPIKSRCEP
ncbi:MAG: hypothetical protein NTX21_11215 [Alphaproteobacteria bacterium]|nr:hypothetical protein [Alphaproteobacteria bacterium]